MFEGRFAERAAVIIGGASGAGMAAARRLVQEGGRVLLWDINAEALEAAKQETGVTHVAALDVANSEALRKLMKSWRCCAGC